MRRLKCEKETIILTNEDDGFYGVYTFNQSLQKRLQAFAEQKWGKASNYTLCLNSSQLGYDRCEKIIMECDMM